MSNLVHNERLKLEATFYNNLAAGFLLGGILLPYYATDKHHWTDALYALAGVVVCVFLHWNARNILLKMRE